MSIFPAVTYEHSTTELQKHAHNIYERCRIKPVPDSRGYSTFKGVLRHLHPSVEEIAFQFELKEDDGGHILAEGKVPESVARELTSDPLSVDIWPGGRRGPVTGEVVFGFDESGKLYLPQTDFEALRERTASPHLSSFAVTNGVRFMDSPTNPLQQIFRFVTKYHIKSEAALRFFVDTLAKHELVLPHYKKS